MTEPQTPQPTKEQVDAANEAEMQKWEGDFKPEDLVIPYKREQVAQSAEEEETTDDVAQVEEEEEYEEPTPVVTLEDPGEYTPKDYSFEIEIKGKTYKVDSSDRAAELADEFAEDLTAKQLVSLVTKGTNIDIKQSKDREDWEKRHNAFEEQSNAEKERQETISSMEKEFNYLVSKGLMPQIEEKYLNADWTDPEVAKQPGVKEQKALLNYMVKENKERAKAGVKQLTSVVDAFNAWQQDNGRKKTAEEHKAAGEARKEASSRVAGVSPAAQAPYVPKGIAVGNPNVFRRNQAIWQD